MPGTPIPYWMDGAADVAEYHLLDPLVRVSPTPSADCVLIVRRV